MYAEKHPKQEVTPDLEEALKKPRVTEAAKQAGRLFIQCGVDMGR
jgi:hypothetical protein